MARGNKDIECQSSRSEVDMTHSIRVAIVQRPPVTKETPLHPVIEERFGSFLDGALRRS